MKKVKNQENSVISWLKTAAYFGVFLSLLPFCVVAFIAVTIYHKLKLFILSKRFRYLDFARSNTIRTLVDTSKNPGILHFVVKIRGKCDLEEIRRAYQQHLLDKKDKNGKLLYPRLKTILISCWGNYAFIKNFDNFRLENHVIMGPTSYKGNPITESNIQKCISSVVSKYMPCEIPAWQIKVIPLSDDSAYYILIRIHHLILDEQRNLNIGDMMLLDRSTGMKVSYSLPQHEKYLAFTPLDQIVKPCVSISKIYENMLDTTISRWNEFVLKHDSLDSHDGPKKPEDLSTLAPSIIMAILNIYIDYKQRASKVLKGSSDPQLHFRFLSELLIAECEKRQLTMKLVLTLILNALHPVNVIKSSAKFMLRTICIWLFLSPFYILRELDAVRRYLFLNDEINSNSYCGFLIKYIPLTFGAFKELLYIAQIIYTAPRMLIEELFLNFNDDDGHYLNSALCGRKLVSWSESISIERLHAKAKRNKQTYSEVMFSTISSCLMSFFEQIKTEEKTTKIPSHIRVNFRSVPFSYLYGVSSSRNGVIGFKLPVAEPSATQFADIREELVQTRKQQIMVYLLSLIQIRFDFLTTVIPSIYLKLLIHNLSKKFAISVTVAMGINEYEPKKYITCYNGEIADVIFFRTPQSNNSTNITIQRFKDTIKMNIMCDSNIQMQHYISNNFKSAFQKVPVYKNPI